MHEVPFKLYPRGFLGARLEGRVERQAAQRIDKESLHFENVRGLAEFRSIVMRDKNEIDQSNPDVEALYAQYIKRTAPSTSFDFRKKILIVALNAFGTMQFDFWYQMQHRSPMAGDMHRRFLDDMLRFIRTGRREMSLETWGALLTAEDNGDHTARLSEYANEFFGIASNGYNRYPQHRALADVIQAWCAQPNGLEDLLGTLHLLFGNE